MAILNQAFALILSTQGSAIYHILLLFVLPAAFFMAVGHRLRYGAASQAARLAIAAGLASLARGIMLVLVGAGLSGLFSTQAILPPLDRAITLVSITLISWAIMIRPGKLWADVMVSLALVAIVILYIVLAIQWYDPGASGLPYNKYDAIFELTKMGVILFSILGLLIFRPTDWGIGLGVFFLLAFGVAYHLIFPNEDESYAAAQRIAEMAAFPLFTVLVYRHALGFLPEVASPPASPTPTLVPANNATTTLPAAEGQTFKVRLTPQAASALAYIAVGSDESDFSKRVSEAVARTLLADYTLLFAPPYSEETLSCINAFDLIREQHLAGFSLASRKTPTLASAIGRGRPARLRWDTHGQELAHLAELLGIPQYGSAIFVPFAEEGSAQNLGGLLVMAAYSQKEWTNEDHNLLASIAKPLTKAIANFNTKSKNAYDLLAELDKANQRATAAEADVQSTQQRLTQLTVELDRAREESKRQLIQIESLTAIIQADATAASKVGTAPLKSPFEAEAEGESEELIALRDQYRRALEELANLNEELSKTQTELEHLQRAGVTPTVDPTLIDSLTAEVTSKQNKLEQAQREIAVLEDRHAEEVAAFTQRLAAAQKEIEQLRQNPAASPPANGEAETLAAKLLFAETEIESLRSALTAANASTNGNGHVDPELAAQLHDAHAEIVSLRHQLQSAPIDAPSVLRSQSAMLLSLIQDLRQPLSSMMGYTDLLLGESVGIIGALQRNFLERVKAGGERMIHTLDDLIRITAIDAGTLMLEETNFEIVDVIEDAFTSVGTQFREKNISFRMDIAEDIPPIAADRDAIAQIISRLLGNACAASEPNTEVVLSARLQADAAIVVSVRDTGGGIADKDLPRVFARSYRADRPLIEGLGETGVGLTIAKTLAEAQGGRIWVESQNGSGSTFSVLLPTNGHQ
jgi:signal transduction histidine kinase